MKTVAERLVWARMVASVNGRPLSQRRLSLLAGLSNRHVCSLESGVLQGHMRGDTVKRLARVLGVPRAWLTYGEGQPSETQIRRSVAAAEARLAAQIAAQPVAATPERRRRKAS